MAAIFIFVAGALFSFYEGITELLEGSEGGGWVYTYAALAAALALEGTSLIHALRQTRRDAGKAPVPRYVRTCRDQTTKTVVFEDSAAVTGVVVAALGVGLHQLTGKAAFDAVGALLIGCLLAVVALGLWRDTRGLLIGEAALPEEREKLQAVLDGHAGVDSVVELLTMALGPSTLLVAARLDLADDQDSDNIERIAREIDEEMRQAVPAVRYVFLDPTNRDEPSLSATPS
jgi:cation diffusion facilitator family transporter